mmetsp:Transcript_33419/g.51295  ORF Transcript_33419/g.51295 Transcript_33419/m.51295 type:complete len:93 (+) Transcript_33419:147-425(+)
MHKGLMGDASVEFFRGVNFHPAVLAHEEHILSLLPTVREEYNITELKTLEDSIKLGQAFIDCQNLMPLKKNPRYVHDEKQKVPKYVDVDQKM